jgi:hypothetical protein
VHKQGPEDEVPFAEYGLVVLTPEHLKVGRSMRCMGRSNQ